MDQIRPRVFSAGLALLLAFPGAGQPDQVQTGVPADVATLKKVLSAAASWNARGRQKFDEGVRKQIAALVAQIRDAKLRARTEKFLPDLEKAAVRHARIRQVGADVKAVKGTTASAPGGPPWLRRLVGDKSMDLFTKLTGIDVYDRAIPIKSGIKNKQITDDWLKCVAGLPDLRDLDISITVVQGPGLRHVGTLKNLESLNLTLTLVTDPQLGQLRGLTNLRKLLLASTKCTGEGFKDLTTLGKLENLNLHYTPVNDAGLEQISRLTSLERLEIVHTHFTDKGARHLSQLTNMRRMQIGSRQATGAAVAALRTMKKLRELDLHDGQVSTEGVKCASQIPSLTVLRLYAGPVKDEGFQHVAKLANLEVLIAQSVQITDAALGHLRGLKKLKRLEIQGNNISAAAGSSMLKKAVPDMMTIVIIKSPVPVLGEGVMVAILDDLSGWPS